MSFKEIEGENLKKFTKKESKQIEQRLSGTFNAFRFIGSIFDLYLTRVKDTLLEMGREPEALETEDEKKELS